jgi:ankyrin repeat protein
MLAYYYFDFNDASNLTLTALLRSLVFQLFGGFDSLPDDLVKLYDECDGGRSQPPVESLAEVLFTLLDATKDKTYVVVDGLDECPAEPERSKLHDLVLSRIGKTSGSYSFLFASRKEYDIEEYMKSVSTHTKLSTIAIQSEKVDSDVRLHVKFFVAEHKRISGWPGSVRQEIEDQLVKGAQGMWVYLPSVDLAKADRFRWVDCQLTSIGECALPGIARRMLKQLPSTLYESYDRILDSVSKENIEAVRSALIVLAHSFRPMTAEEIAEAVLINVDEQSFDPEEISDDPLSLVLELCSGLVSTTIASWFELMDMYGRVDRSKQTVIVRFAHYSVKEYILSDRNRHTDSSLFFFSEDDAHKHIAEALLLYIFAMAARSKYARPNRHTVDRGLCKYASQYVMRHCHMIPRHVRSRQLAQHICRLFNADSPEPYIYWHSWHDHDYTTDLLYARHIGTSISNLGSPLYFASLLGEVDLVQWLISNDYKIDEPSGHCRLGDPMQAAALGNHVEIVRLLLEQGAQVNTDHGYFGDPLQAAAFGGGTETVQILLDRGATLDTDHGEYGNALIAAAYGGNHEIAKALIDRGINPELSSRKHGGAIAGAATSRQPGLIKLLLTKGQDINDPNPPKGSALYCVAKSGDVDNARMLIRGGANVNLVSGELHTALQVACNEGHLEMVRLLLGNGANVNVFGGRLDSALQACIDFGNLDILHLLLENNADLDHEGGIFKSPLRCATFRGRITAAEVLLDRGAKFNDEIVLKAIGNGHSTLIQRMILKGINVNAQNTKGTALQLAIRHGDTDTAKTLLACDGIDVGVCGGPDGDTAFHLALEKGNVEIVEELLKRGADVNAKSGRYGTPLAAAVVGRNESLVRLLLERGADVNGHRLGYESALNIAACVGQLDIVELLLNHGMDINELSGNDGQTKCTYSALQDDCD